jgi:hypothetical protein
MSMPRRVVVIGASFLDLAVASLGLSFCSGSAWAQAVTLAELEGSVIDVSAVHQEKIIRNGNLRTPELHMSGHFAIGSGGTITTQFQTSAVGPWGQGDGPTRSGTFTIGKPGKGQQGNDVVWVFSDGELRRLVVHHETVCAVPFRCTWRERMEWGGSERTQ